MPPVQEGGMEMISDNSIEAYKKAFKTGRLDTLRFRVYQCVCSCPGLTDEEIALRIGVQLCSVTPRLTELHDNGFVVFDDTINHKKNKCRRSYPKDGEEELPQYVQQVLA